MKEKRKEKGSRKQAETSVCWFPGVPVVFLGKAMGGRPRRLAAVCPEKPLVHLSTSLTVPQFDHGGDSLSAGG